MTITVSALRKKAQRLELKLSVKDEMFALLEYNPEGDMWVPISDCWGPFIHCLHQEDVGEILEERALV